MDSRHCSIPRNVIAAIMVNGAADVGPPRTPGRNSIKKGYNVCVLVKNGRSLVVQSEYIPGTTRPLSADRRSTEENIRFGERVEYLYSQRVALIASVIDTIDFDKYQYAFLVNVLGQYRLVSQDPAYITPFSASQGWIRRVQETDIEVIQWVNGKVRCKWNNRQVEVFVPYTFSKRWWIQQMIDMLYVFQKHNLDITSEPLGLVMRGTEIIGLMMAQTTGRPLQMRDRRLVYDVLSKLHEADIVFESSINHCTFFITDDNKIRFLQGIHCFVQYDNVVNEEDSYWKAYWERANWESVDELFQPEILENTPWDMMGCARLPTLLNYIPSPERFKLAPFDFYSVWVTKTQLPRRSGNQKALKAGSRSSALKLANTPGIVARRKPSYHPYHATNSTKDLLLALSERSMDCQHRDNDVITTLVISRRKDGAARGAVRAVSIESQSTLMNADDDATVFGDNDK